MTDKSMGRHRVHDTPSSLNNTERLGYPENYPLNGSDEKAEKLQSQPVGRWPKAMFESRETGDHLEIWRKTDEPTSADVRDAARRDNGAGLKMLNRLNKARQRHE